MIEIGKEVIKNQHNWASSLGDNPSKKHNFGT